MSRLQPLQRRVRRTRADMNVVPYIDVMLVLLVIFMVVAPMIQTRVLSLPTVGSANAAQEPPFIIEMDATGRLSTSTQKFANTDEMVNQVVQQAQNKPVVLAADKAIAYGDVMAVMDALKKANVQRVGLLLQQK